MERGRDGGEERPCVPISTAGRRIMRKTGRGMVVSGGDQRRKDARMIRQRIYGETIKGRSMERVAGARIG